MVLFYFLFLAWNISSVKDTGNKVWIAQVSNPFSIQINGRMSKTLKGFCLLCNMASIRDIQANEIILELEQPRQTQPRFPATHRKCAVILALCSALQRPHLETKCWFEHLPSGGVQRQARTEQQGGENTAGERKFCEELGLCSLHAGRLREMGLKV